LAGIVVHTTAGAHHIAPVSIPTRLAHAVTGVHRDLVAVRTRVVACRTHPAMNAVCAHGREVRIIAESTTVTVGNARLLVRTLNLLTAGATPAREASAGVRASIAEAITTTWRSDQHTGDIVQVTVAGAAWCLTNRSPVSLQVVADAEACCGVEIAVSGAFGIAADTSPARITNAIARVHRDLITH